MNRFYRKDYIFHNYKFLRKRSMIARIVWNWLQLERNQWVSRSKLENIQFKKLKAIITHAYDEVPFYKKFYDQYGMTPNDLKSLEDIQKFPILSRELVRDTPFKERIATHVNISQCSAYTTSGSTGIPVIVLEDKYSADYLDAYHLRRLVQHGYEPWHKILHFTTQWPPKKETIGTTGNARSGLTKKIRERMVKRLMAGMDINKHIELLKMEQPDFLIAPPSYLKVIAKTIHERNNVKIKPKVIISCGEVLDHSSRTILSSSFGSEVYNGYGCIEIAPMGMAWECRQRLGLHINSDVVFLEFLRDGEPISAGESGEVVATSLFRSATPLIRYRVGDIATPSDDRCPCGRQMPLIKHVDGRIVDFIKMPDESLISPYSLILAIQEIPGVAKFQVRQESKYKITIFIDKGKDFNEGTLTQLNTLCLEIFGTDLQFHIEIVENFPIERGRKFRSVESLL
jgi:phenylacetate-CoA ligase